MSIILAALILFLPFIHWYSWGARGWELPKVVIIQATALVLLALYLLASKLPKKNSILLLIVFVWLVLTTLTSVNPEVALFGSYWRGQGLLFWLSCLLIFFLAKYNARYLTYAIGVAATIESIIIIYQSISLYILNNLNISYAGRPIGTFGQANFAAGFLVMSLPTILFLAAKNRIFLAFAFLQILGISLTLSKAGIFAMFSVLFLYYIVQKKQKIKKAAIFAFAIILVVFAFLSIKTNIINTPSLANRLTIWSKSVQLIAQKPITGYGADSQGEILGQVIQTNGHDFWLGPLDRTHNIFLDLTLQFGLIGSALFCLLVWKNIRRKCFEVYLALLGFFIYAFFDTLSAVHWAYFFIFLSFP